MKYVRLHGGGLLSGRRHGSRLQFLKIFGQKLFQLRGVDCGLDRLQDPGPGYHHPDPYKDPLGYRVRRDKYASRTGAHSNGEADMPSAGQEFLSMQKAAALSIGKDLAPERTEEGSCAAFPLCHG